MTVVLCPRCRELGYLKEEGRQGTSRAYLFVVHMRSEGGRRVQWKCYLGPKGSYSHANSVLSLALANAFEEDYEVVARLAASRLVEKALLAVEEAERLAERGRLSAEEAKVRKREAVERATKALEELKRYVERCAERLREALEAG